MTISAVLFDLGGVLTENPFGAMVTASSRVGMDVREFADIAIGRSDYGGGSHPWHQLERGEIELDDYNVAIDQLARDRGHEDGFPPLPVDLISADLAIRPAMIELVTDLGAAGVPTGMVTNNVQALASWRDLADWDALFDVVIDSSAVGMRKPEPRIFQHACAELGVELTASAFLDDMEPNVDAAAAIGMTAILVDEPAPAIARVRDLVDL